ncbi:MAG: ribonuclease HI family protein [Candidatus Bathyarchaeota archaeon]
MSKIKIYTDGASRGNPGPSAFAFIILDEFGRILKKYSEYAGIGTNNETEYKALISALKAAKQFSSEAECFSDSMLIVNQMRGIWKVKHPNMKSLWKEAAALRYKFQSISFSHVPRTNTYIQKVDELANQTLDRVNEKQVKQIEKSNKIQTNFVNKEFTVKSNKNEESKGKESRIYPGYMTGSEYGRERNRLDNMVKGFLKWNPNNKVGETENFIIEVDTKNKSIYLQEKNIVADCPFKISINFDEVEDIIKQLNRAINESESN